MSFRQETVTRAVLASLALEFAVAAGLAVVGSLRHVRLQEARNANRQLVSKLGLTDLALWSDASYCRHPSLASFFSAHADHPSALEHFPAGSMVPPPNAEILLRTDGP